jgi:quercetin dioxygenase-like cupin family protein
MLKTLVLPVVLFCAGLVSAQDAVQVDPEHHKVEFENDQIRVVRMVYPPGYKTPMHGHLPGVTVMLSSTKIHTWNKSGDETDTESESGAVSWSDGTTVHANQVKGDRALELLRVEIKKNGKQALTLPTDDAVKVDPEHNKVELENDQVRVVRSTLPVGYEIPLHQHLPGVSITTTDRTWEAAYQGDPETAAQLVKAGSVGGLSEGGPPHRTKNVGKSVGESVRVELKTKL